MGVVSYHDIVRDSLEMRTFASQTIVRNNLLRKAKREAFSK